MPGRKRKTLLIRFASLAEVQPEKVEQLLDHAFGADRRARTAYRIREGQAAIRDLSFAAFDGDDLIGTIQCWAVQLNADDGADLPLVMVGPVAVEPARQRDGLGRALMRLSLDAAAERRADGALMLIGDPEYYERFFGFTAERTGGWRAPGPFEPRRLLARGDSIPPRSGMLGPRVTTPA